MSETTSSRLLTLLSLLQGRRDWPGSELADRQYREAKEDIALRTTDLFFDAYAARVALDNAGGLFKRLQNEMEESGIHTYRPGPWHAGLEPFPDG